MYYSIEVSINLLRHSLVEDESLLLFCRKSVVIELPTLINVSGSINLKQALILRKQIMYISMKKQAIIKIRIAMQVASLPVTLE